MRQSTEVLNGCAGRAHQNSGPSNVIFSSLLKEDAQGGFEADLRSGELRTYCPMIVPYCCDIFEAKDLYAAWHGAERRHP